MKYLIIALLMTSCAKEGIKTYRISANVFGEPLYIKTDESFAGGINSFNWGGFEYLTDFDHGRGMQATFRTNWAGECFNPTESGNRQDYKDSPSSSSLEEIYTNKNYMRTQTRMAFWLTTTDNYYDNCPLKEKSLRNTKNLSDEVLYKQITIGIPKHENVIVLDEKFYIAENNLNDGGGFEGVTNYSSPDLNTAYIFNLNDNNITPYGIILQATNSGPNPYIVATKDGKRAIGSLIKEIPIDATNYAYTVARFRDNYLDNAPSTIWSNVFYIPDVKQGYYHFKTYIIIGNLTQVTQTMIELNSTIRN